MFAIDSLLLQKIIILRLMKKLLSLLFLLCSVAAFAEEEVQDMPVGRGECLSPGIILVPFLLMGICMFAAPSIYYFAKRRGKINRNNKLWKIRFGKWFHRNTHNQKSKFGIGIPIIESL